MSLRYSLLLTVLVAGLALVAANPATVTLDLLFKEVQTSLGWLLLWTSLGGAGLALLLRRAFHRKW